MPKPLNERLYERLVRAFGEVRISKPGMAFVGRKCPVMNRWAISQKGEYYAVNCFACGDTECRLYVNHSWSATVDDEQLRFLIHCFNEPCMVEYKNRRALYDMVWGGAAFARVDITKGRIADPNQPVYLPGALSNLGKLPRDHKAIHYVKDERGIDPAHLSDYYGAGYCRFSLMANAQDRLVFPVCDHKGVLRSWQARYIGELPWKDKSLARQLPLKFYNCPEAPVSPYLGNLHIARKFMTVVLVEGWFDVFSTGPWAACLLGKALDSHRVELLAKVLHPDAKLVLLLDPEEYETLQTRDICCQLHTRFSGRFVSVHLPAGTDPGSLDRERILSICFDQAEEQDISLDFSPVPAV